VVLGDVELAARKIAVQLGAISAERRSAAWTAELVRADARATRALEADVARGPFSEAAAARALLAAAPAGSMLVAGNSLAVRHLDLHAPVSDNDVAVLHQRGAAGIDGLVSGAAGAASVADAPVALLCGDLSMLHDVGGLAVARTLDQPLPIVVLQNGGGRIFEELPVARAIDRATFERAFVAPQAFDLQAAAAAFGVAFTRVQSRAEIDAALSEAFARLGATVVEAVVPPGDAAARLSRLVESIQQESS
jgi:2-succinyl-5-enolpyruvyl-6-hydroxy-3-cyclohexene-1-carboxylate synthase